MIQKATTSDTAKPKPPRKVKAWRLARRDEVVRFSGELVHCEFAPGSKSEHLAVCLLDGEGKAVRVRRLGKDPFYDPVLEALVGKTIQGVGEVVHGNTLIMSDWEEAPA